jgi:iron complex outermembrane receptor protein
MLDAGRSRSPIGARFAAALVGLCAGLAAASQRRRPPTRRRARFPRPPPRLPPAPAPAPAPATPARTPAPTNPPATTPAPATSKEAEVQRLAPVQITGGRPDDVQERRNSTTAKIIVGREEIDRFGDSTLGDVLKRLPGVTIQGGRGGAARSACAASAAATPRSCSMASGCRPASRSIR